MLTKHLGVPEGMREALKSDSWGRWVCLITKVPQVLVSEKRTAIFDADEVESAIKKRTIIDKKRSQKEAEMMELLSSIIMDANTTTEQAQETKIQVFIQGIFKDIKPDTKNIQPKKRFTFARLPKLLNNEAKLINKYIQALNKAGKAALFQVKRNLREWLLGVAKYRWNTEDLLEDRTRQLSAPKDQPIQFTPNYKNAVAPNKENQDIS
jgi:hypothetical protein